MLEGTIFFFVCFYPFLLFHLLCVALEFEFDIGSKEPFAGRAISLAKNWVVESRMEKVAKMWLNIFFLLIYQTNELVCFVSQTWATDIGISM